MITMCSESASAFASFLYHYSNRSRLPSKPATSCKERFDTIERVFGWEDKFRRLLLRFERLSQLHYAFKTLAYTMINLRHFC